VGIATKVLKPGSCDQRCVTRKTIQAFSWAPFGSSTYFKTLSFRPYLAGGVCPRPKSSLTDQVTQDSLTVLMFAKHQGLNVPLSRARQLPRLVFLINGDGPPENSHPRNNESRSGRNYWQRLAPGYKLGSERPRHNWKMCSDADQAQPNGLRHYGHDGHIKSRTRGKGVRPWAILLAYRLLFVFLFLACDV